MKADYLQPGNVDYLDRELLDDGGLIRVRRAAFLRTLNQDDLRLWLHHRAVYLLPSVELVEWLRSQIGDRRAIEIGAGNGVVGRSLGIPITDNLSQAWPDVKAYYALIKQPTITYPKDVQEIAALDAIATYRPQVVVACWVTHLYREDEHERAGNMYGVDEDKVLDSGIETYIHVGATSTHGKKRILSRPHKELRPDWLFGRGKPEDRVIWVWEVRR